MAVDDPHAHAIAVGLAVNWVEDQEMHNGRDGGPIVVEPEDRLGPNEANPERRYYVNAPQYHWHHYAQGGVDEGARAAIQQLGEEAFVFGQMTEQRMQELHAQAVNVAWTPKAVEDLQRKVQDLEKKPDGMEAEKVAALHGDVHRRLDEEQTERRNVATDVQKMEERLQQLQFEVRKGQTSVDSKLRTLEEASKRDSQADSARKVADAEYRLHE